MTSPDSTSSPSSTSPVTVVELDAHDQFPTKHLTFAQVAENPRKPKLQLLFTSSVTAKRELRGCSPNPDERVIPSAFWKATDFTDRENNGFFGCRSIFDENGKVIAYETWFQFLVKQVTKPKNTNITSYEWLILGFCTKWMTGNRNIVTALDVPESLRFKLEKAFFSKRNETQDAYLPHVIILEEIWAVYEEKVWGLRDFVRTIEKDRSRSRTAQPNFDHLHETQRHLIHSSETLGVAIDSTESMLMQLDQFFQNEPPGIPRAETTHKQRKEQIYYWFKMYRAIRYRSQALVDRFQTDINLAFNVVAQLDSQDTRKISFAAQRDSAAMRVIAVVTLIFLPGTFVSTIFGMTFFSTSQDPQDSTLDWTVSSKFWIYWAVTAPLTLLTVTTWLMWQRSTRFY